MLVADGLRTPGFAAELDAGRREARIGREQQTSGARAIWPARRSPSHEPDYSVVYFGNLSLRFCAASMCALKAGATLVTRSFTS